MIKTGTDHIGISTSFYCHNKKGQWLLHKRSKACRDERGVWDSGGGKLEFGLTLEENVLKEIREEYGCEAIIEEMLPAITLIRKTAEGSPTHWIIIPFVLLIPEIEEKKVQIGDKEKMELLGWYSLSTLPAPLHSGFRKTVALHEARFRSYSVTR